MSNWPCKSQSWGKPRVSIITLICIWQPVSGSVYSTAWFHLQETRVWCTCSLLFIPGATPANLLMASIYFSKCWSTCGRARILRFLEIKPHWASPSWNLSSLVKSHVGKRSKEARCYNRSSFSILILQRFYLCNPVGNRSTNAIVTAVVTTFKRIATNSLYDRNPSKKNLSNDSTSCMVLPPKFGGEIWCYLCKIVLRFLPTLKSS